MYRCGNNVMPAFWLLSLTVTIFCFVIQNAWKLFRLNVIWKRSWWCFSYGADWRGFPSQHLSPPHSALRGRTARSSRAFPTAGGAVLRMRTAWGGAGGCAVRRGAVPCCCAARCRSAGCRGGGPCSAESRLSPRVAPRAQRTGGWGKKESFRKRNWWVLAVGFAPCPGGRCTPRCSAPRAALRTAVAVTHGVLQPRVGGSCRTGCVWCWRNRRGPFLRVWMEFLIS